MNKYRAMVGPPGMFDIIGAQQFNVMIANGLREEHRLLDVGCGCLRGGRLFITYLKHGKYVGVEPNKELLNYGIDSELGRCVCKIKMPIFYTRDDFTLARMPAFKYHDFVLAQSILSHAGEDLLATIFGEAHLALVPGGKFIGTFFEGEQNQKQGWLGTDVAKYDRVYLKGISDIVGFTSFKILPVVHPMGQLWFAAQKGK